VVVDPRRDPGCREYVDGLGELVLVVGGVGPYQWEFGRARPVISRPISATWATNGRFRTMNAARPASTGTVCRWTTTGSLLPGQVRPG
jgi:hypothetical protein